MYILPPALFLHSSPHNLGRKMFHFLPFIDKLPYIHLQLTRHYVWMSVIYIYIVFTTSPNRTDVGSKQKYVTHNQRQDGVSKCQCCFVETGPGVTTLFQAVQRHALSLVRNVNSIVDDKVWMMGGVVLQGLVMPMLSKAKK